MIRVALLNDIISSEEEEQEEEEGVEEEWGAESSVRRYFFIVVVPIQAIAMHNTNPTCTEHRLESVRLFLLRLILLEAPTSNNRIEAPQNTERNLQHA